MNDFPNRFELVLLAAQRTRQLSGGSPATLNKEGDRNAVLSLRELDAGTVSPLDLQESLIQNYQQTLLGEELEEDALESQLIEFVVEDQPSPSAKTPKSAPSSVVSDEDAALFEDFDDGEE